MCAPDSLSGASISLVNGHHKIIEFHKSSYLFYYLFNGEGKTMKLVIRKKVSELFDLCLELDKPDFKVSFKYYSHLDRLEVSTPASMIEAYTDDVIGEVLSNICKAKFYLIEENNDR